MHKTLISGCLALGIGVIAPSILSPCALAQPSPAQHVAPSRWIPDSNKQGPADVGSNSHTNMVVLSLADRSGNRPQGAPYAGYFYETPSSLACVYGLVTQTTGCNPATASALPSASSSQLAIAIVDAYDNPDALTDLATFSRQFGLPAPTSSNFQVVYASGSKPSANSGWSLESSLDIEWAHAMAPGAKIYLVEARSASNSDLLAAVDKATTLLVAAGGGVVSMSWGGSEFSSEASYDSHFQNSKVTYIASSGDSPGVIWPSVSQYVVAAGGTSVSRNPSTGVFEAEQTWQQTGGGISAYLARPAYQSSVSAIVGTHRGVPDIAAVADPDTGVWVYSQYGASQCDNSIWCVVGGTSVASPVSAGILSWKAVHTTSIQQVLNTIYTASGSGFRDVTSGNCGPYAGWLAGAGWDLCTGRGSIAAASTTLVISGVAP